MKDKGKLEDYTLEDLNNMSQKTVIQNLGIRYVYADYDRVEGTMPVDERTCQPFGYLAGGSTLCLAETLAGLGSLIHCGPDEVAVGIQVSGSHVSATAVGDTVRGIATPIHLGRSTHVWNVDVIEEGTEKLICSVRVTNSVLKK